ncbi:hypothetical protein KZC52_11860 [Microbacterium sp. kSW2-24]|uniref:hypothetical protein n=1 Tax=Microbacterium galbinum TaxID=2851646 RepID=UPI001FFDC9FA|nr:hypothetical protein [Microbacterium galbinum]MCK2023624.1 hypothetical protein [Microbacterium galbinum]
MEAIGLYALLAFVIVVPIVWAVIGRRVRARAAEAGTTAGVSLEKRVRASSATRLHGDAVAMGARLVFADAPRGRATVDSALAGIKAVTRINGDTWHIAHGSPRAVTAVWAVDEHDRGVFYAARATETLGSLIATHTWKKVLTKIQELAAAQGVEVEASVSALVRTDEKDAGDAVWVAAL